MKNSILHDKIRPPAVASVFYPGDVSELHAEVMGLLESVGKQTEEPPLLPEGCRLQALIVPHAGYVYSGSTAARAYRCLEGFREEIIRIVIFGPAHRVWLNGAGVPGASAFETPLGSIPIAQALIRELLESFSFVEVRDDAHEEEHCLEVQLPFLQELLDEFELLPLLVGDTPAANVADLMDILLEDRGNLLLLSTDLSHFHSYPEAVDLDGRTAEAIESFDHAAIAPEQACGAHPLRGLLLLARRHGWNIMRLGLCNSGDTARTRDRVVGYGAWAVTAPL